MQWIRISKQSELDAILRPALGEIQEFNTVSGGGHRDKQNRLLTLVGYKTKGLRTTQQLGITFAEKPDLQLKALDLIGEIYAGRNFGQSIYTWLPKSMERRVEEYGNE